MIILPEYKRIFQDETGVESFGNSPRLNKTNVFFIRCSHTAQRVEALFGERIEAVPEPQIKHCRTGIRVCNLDILDAVRSKLTVPGQIVGQHAVCTL